MLPTFDSQIPGYVPRSAPDRYPTRADWPTPGTQGTLNGRPVKLMTIWHAYRALFQTGPYSTCNADLQQFIPDERSTNEAPRK